MARAEALERSITRPPTKGTTIVDPHHDGAPVRLVGHANTGSERQGAMRGRQSMGVEALAIGCRPTMEAGTVPGGHTGLTARAGLASA